MVTPKEADRSFNHLWPSWVRAKLCCCCNLKTQNQFNALTTSQFGRGEIVPTRALVLCLYIDMYSSIVAIDTWYMSRWSAGVILPSGTGISQSNQSFSEGAASQRPGTSFARLFQTKGFAGAQNQIETVLADPPQRPGQWRRMSTHKWKKNPLRFHHARD